MPVIPFSSANRAASLVDDAAELRAEEEAKRYRAQADAKLKELMAQRVKEFDQNGGQPMIDIPERVTDGPRVNAPGVETPNPYLESGTQDMRGFVPAEGSDLWGQFEQDRIRKAHSDEVVTWQGGNSTMGAGGPDNPVNNPGITEGIAKDAERRLSDAERQDIEERYRQRKDAEASADVRSRLMSDSNPDAAAKALELAPKSGASRLEVQRNLETFTRADMAREIDRMRAEAPRTESWMRASPDNFDVSYDDTENLSWWEQAQTTLGAFGGGVGGSLAAGWTGISESALGLGELASEGNDAFASWVAGRNIRSGVSDWFEARRKAAGQISEDFRPDVEDPTARAALQGVESLPVSALAVAATIMTGGAATPALLTMGGSTAGKEYGRASDQGMSWAGAAGYASGQGSIEAATEMLPMKWLVGDIIKETPFVKTLIKNQFAEGATEQVATHTQDFLAWAVLPENADKPINDYWSERGSASYDTLVASLVGSGVQTSVAKAADAGLRQLSEGYQQKRSEDLARFVQAMGDNAKDSKLLKRLPDKYREAVASITKDGPRETAYIAPEAMQALAHTTGKSVDEIALAFRIEPEAIQSAMDNGEFVAVPIGNYAAVVQTAKKDIGVSGETIYAALQNDLKFSNDGKEFTVNEYKAEQELQKAEREAAAEMGKTDVAFAEATDRVRADVQKQIEETGLYDPETASVQADLAYRIFTSIPMGTGEDVETFWQQQGPQIVAAVTGQPAREGESTPHSIAKLISPPGFITGKDKAGKQLTFQPRDIVLGYNDKDTATAMAAEFGVDEEHTSNYIHQAATRIRASVRTAIEDGQIDALASAWNVTPDELIKFASPRFGAGAFEDLMSDVADIVERDNRNGHAPGLAQVAERLAARGKAVSVNTLKVRLANARNGSGSGVLPETVRERIRKLKFARGRNAATGSALAHGGQSVDALFYPPTKTRKSVIEIFQTRTLPALSHESAHWYLDTLYRMAKAPDAHPYILKQWAAILEWNGKHAEWDAMFEADGVTFTAEGKKLQELFAETFEAYLMTAQAPNTAMRSVFATVRQWLMHAYKALRQGMGNAIRSMGVYTPEKIAARERELGRRMSDQEVVDFIVSPEIKEIFNRMLAAEDAIDGAQAVLIRDSEKLAKAMLDKSDPDGKWTDVRRQKFLDKLRERYAGARERAVANLTARLIDEHIRRETTTWKEDEREVRREVQSEIDERPEQRAYQVNTGIGWRDTRETAAEEAARQAEAMLALAHADGYVGTDFSEAKEWLEAKAKGLDLSEDARAARAKAMGFTAKAFHETTEDSAAGIMSGAGFELNRRRASTGDHVMPVGVFTKPSAGKIGIGKAQIPLLLRLGNTRTFADRAELEAHLSKDADYAALVAEMKAADARFKAEHAEAEKAWDNSERLSPEYFRLNDEINRISRAWESEINRLGEMARSRATDVLQAEGLNSITVLKDEGSFTRSVKTTVVFDPKDMRSVNAAFDPDRSDSSQLLAHTIKRPPLVVDDATVVRASEALTEYEFAVWKSAISGKSNQEIADNPDIASLRSAASRADLDALPSAENISILLAVIRRKGFDSGQSKRGRDDTFSRDIERLLAVGLDARQINERLGRSEAQLETTRVRVSQIKARQRSLAHTSGIDTDWMGAFLDSYVENPSQRSIERMSRKLFAQGIPPAIRLLRYGGKTIAFDGFNYTHDDAIRILGAPEDAERALIESGDTLETVRWYDDAGSTLAHTAPSRQLDEMGFYSAAQEAALRVPDGIWQMGWQAARNSLAKGRDGIVPKRSEIEWLLLDPVFAGTLLKGDKLKQAVLEHIEAQRLSLVENFVRGDPKESFTAELTTSGRSWNIYDASGNLQGIVKKIAGETASDVISRAVGVGLEVQPRGLGNLVRGPGDIRLPGEDVPLFEMVIALPPGAPGSDYQAPRSHVGGKMQGTLVTAHGEERIDDKGQRTVFVGQVQSDMAQEMRGAKDLLERNERALQQVIAESGIVDRETALAWMRSHGAAAENRMEEYSDEQLIGIARQNWAGRNGVDYGYGRQVSGALQAMIDAPLNSTSEWTNVAVRAMIYRAAREGFQSISFPTAETSELIQGNDSAAQHYETNVKGALEKIGKQLGGEVRRGGVAEGSPRERDLYRVIGPNGNYRGAMANKDNAEEFRDIEPGSTIEVVPKGTQDFASAYVLDITPEMRAKIVTGGFPLFHTRPNPNATTTPPPGIPPMKLNLQAVLEQYGEKALAEIPPDVAAHSMSANDVEMYVELARNVKKSLSKKRPASLWKFLAKPRKTTDGITYRGIRDPDGEIMKMIGAKKEAKGLIADKEDDGKRARSYDIEQAAQAAWEAGYFSGESPPTPAAFLDALRADHDGTAPLYAREDVAIVDEIRNAEQWAEWFDQNDVDIKATVAEQREKLAIVATSQGENAISPDEAAAVFNGHFKRNVFPTGLDFLNGLKQGPQRNKLIRDETERRMIERFGDIFKSGKVMEEAQAYARNEIQHRQFEIELEALAEAAGRPAAANLAKQTAIENLRSKQVREVLNYNQWLVLERRWGQKAAEAAAKGDMAKAMEFARYRLLNSHMYTEGKKLAEQIEKTRKGLLRYGEKPAQTRLYAAGKDYAEQMQGLLSDYQLRNESKKAENKRASRAVWLQTQMVGVDPFAAYADPTKTAQEQMVAAAEAIERSDMLARLAEGIEAQNYKSITVDELMAVKDEADLIYRLATLKDKLIKEGERRRLSLAAEDIAAEVYENQPNEKPPEPIETDTPGEKAKAGVKKYFAMHRTLQSMAHQFAGGKDGGVFWRYIVRPLNEAFSRLSSLRKEMGADVSKLFGVYTKAEQERFYRDRRHFKGIGRPLTTQGRLAIALNWGNEKNRRRIMDAYGWDQAQVQEVLDSLDKRDWDFVQATWDYLDTWFPEANRVHEAVHGAPMTKEDASPIATRFGVYKGGYYPIKFDPMLSSKAGQRAVEADAKKQTGRVGVRTQEGFTKKRVSGKVTMPLRLSALDVISQHLDEVAKSIATEEVLFDVGRIIKQKSVEDAIVERHGRQTYNTIVNQIVTAKFGMEGTSGLLAHLRNGATVVGLSWKVATASLQILGASNSAVRIGPTWLARGYARMGKDAVSMQASARWIMDRSEFMRSRREQQSPEMASLLDAMKTKWTPDFVARVIPRELRGAHNWFIRNGFALMSNVQFYSVDMPTWYGAYFKAQHNGSDQAGAVAIADQAVIDAQGGGDLHQLAAMQSGAGTKYASLLRILTNFMSYMVTTYNLGAQRVRNARTPAQIAALGVDFIMLAVIPVAGKMIIDMLTRGIGGDDEPEEWAERYAREQVAFLFGPFVGFSQFAGAARGEDAYGYKGPAGLAFFSEMNSVGKAVAEADFDASFWKPANRAAGMVFHYPASQIDASVRGALAYFNGETDNPAAFFFGPAPTN